MTVSPPTATWASATGKWQRGPTSKDARSERCEKSWCTGSCCLSSLSSEHSDSAVSSSSDSLRMRWFEKRDDMDVSQDTILGLGVATVTGLQPRS